MEKNNNLYYCVKSKDTIPLLMDELHIFMDFLLQFFKFFLSTAHLIFLCNYILIDVLEIYYSL
jgi:hypothetical protein